MGRKNTTQKSRTKKRQYTYDNFNQIDGLHPWQTAAPDGFVGYKVRTLPKGKICFFNFLLAKDMGLISKDHPHELNPKLEKKLLETFNIQIINEYDIDSEKKFDSKTIKPNEFMATRYLQLQHENKQGKTSGDGRSIWNGFIYYKGKYWDVSSRGTGVTQLAPAAVTAQKNLETGNKDHGYGCGQAEIDELISSAIMSEIMHFQGITTERVLCIVDNGNGVGIGVRAGHNLLRPAHIFRYLKMNEYKPMVKAFDYLIERQTANKTWNFDLNKKKYENALEALAVDFAQFSAVLDRNYIFTWLDWDGDNVLADGGIIDYGSVRQLGIRHDQYRYDDVERFSTNLNEQKSKARLTVQVFAQLVDYITTKEKKPLKHFADHICLELFDQEFESYQYQLFCEQLGFERDRAKELTHDNHQELKELFESFSYLERFKSRHGEEDLPDGVNKPAIFNVRKLLAFLPKNLHENWHVREHYNPSAYNLHELMLVEEADGKDKVMSSYQEKRINEFIVKYRDFMIMALKDFKNPKLALNFICDRARSLNATPKVTGNAVEFVVKEILAQHHSKKSKFTAQQAIELFIYHNSPEPAFLNPMNMLISLNKSLSHFIEKSIVIVNTYAEDI